jgi:hypothetical protein
MQGRYAGLAHYVSGIETGIDDGVVRWWADLGAATAAIDELVTALDELATIRGEPICLRIE